MIIINEKFNERILIEKINGITLYIIPKPGFTTCQGAVVTKYGALDLNFFLNNKSVSSPAGIAHFIEHKIFQDKYFEGFLNEGSYINAYTNYELTSYYFTDGNFNKCLEMLLNMVFEINLTEKNITKEKEIIKKEIEMYNGQPNAVCFNNMKRGMYHNLPIVHDIAGSFESLEVINKKILETCYNSFYRPQNMYIVCSGDFDIDKTRQLLLNKLCYNNYNNDNFSVEKQAYDEPVLVKTNYVEESMDIGQNIFCIGFKDNDINNYVYNNVVTKLALDIIAGESSRLYQQMYNNNILDDTFNFDYSCGKAYGLSLFSGISNNAKKLLETLLKEIESIKLDGINKNRFEQIRRKHMGQYYSSFNSIPYIVESQTSLGINDQNIFDKEKILESVKVEDVEKRLSNLGNHTLSVVIANNTKIR